MSEAMREAFEIVDQELRRDIPAGGSRVVRAWSKIKAALSGAQQGEAIGWRKAKDGEHWPHIGGKYLIKLNGVLQHEVYEFDQGDDGMGGGEYFWVRDDLDEGAPFNPEKDEWLPIDEAGMPAAPQPAQVPDGFEIASSPHADDRDIRVSWRKGDAHLSAWLNPSGEDCDDVVGRLLWKMANAMLTAAPSGDAKPFTETSRPIDDAMVGLPNGSFKAFHASLCRRFGFPHDDQYWWRDLVSLEEHIAAGFGDAKREAEIKAEALEEFADGLIPGDLLQALPVIREKLEFAARATRGRAARLRQSSDGDDSEGVE